MTAPIVKLTKKGIRFISKNSNVILTAGSIAGAILSTAFAIKGTIKAVKLVEEKQVSGKKEIIKTVWKCYIPTVGMVLMTTIVIACNGRINSKRLAMVTSLYSTSQKALQEYQEKVVDTIGERKEQKIRNDIDKDHLDQIQAPPEDQIIKTGKGDFLFRDDWSGQWFRSNPDAIENARLKTLQNMKEDIEGGIVYLQYAYEQLGLKNCGCADQCLWDWSDIQVNGGTFDFHVSSEWAEVNGKQEIVGTLHFNPWPIPQW